tara:strand:+ start:248 stop:508 length:261 start_codon:yes stop_codon:yes gene_type:complete
MKYVLTKSMKLLFDKKLLLFIGKAKKLRDLLDKNPSYEEALSEGYWQGVSDTLIYMNSTDKYEKVKKKTKNKGRVSPIFSFSKFEN